MANLGTLYVNNQIVPAPQNQAFYPAGAGYPYFRGNGQGPATVPLNYKGTGSSGTEGEAANAASMPFSIIHSPVIWAIIFLVVGVAGLRYVHWRG